MIYFLNNYFYMRRKFHKFISSFKKKKKENLSIPSFKRMHLREEDHYWLWCIHLFLNIFGLIDWAMSRYPTSNVLLQVRKQASYTAKMVLAENIESSEFVTSNYFLFEFNQPHFQIQKPILYSFKWLKKRFLFKLNIH